MRYHRLTLLFTTFTSLFSYQQSACGYSTLTQHELEQELQNPVVEHQTAKGVIVCRDPQIEYNEADWVTDENHRRGGHLREHMLVDTVVNKRLLSKDESFIDKLFSNQKLGLDAATGLTGYSIFATTSRCGDVPSLRLDAAFDKNHKLIRYRTRYSKNGGQSPFVDSEWVEE